MDKYEYLTGQDLNYKPSTVEQAKLDCSPLSKFSNRGLKEEEEKKGLLKRLKNIEDKNEKQLDEIAYQGKKQLDIINEQGRNNGKDWKRKKNKIVLLRDELNNILIDYEMNVTAREENILRRAAEDERLINYNNFFFKTGDPTIKNYDF